MRKSRLLTIIASPDYLKKAWASMNKSNGASRGVSKETIDDFSSSLDANIQQISKHLKSRKYKFENVRPVLLEKKEKGKFRPLRIAEVRDRLVQKALSMKLEELLSDKFQLNNPCSFAYRSGARIEDAIQSLVNYYKAGYTVILEADIKKFFDNVNRKKLLKKVYNNLPDKTINKLLREAISQEVDRLEDIDSQYHHYFLDSIQGIPQGNSLSPLLANIYLSEFDQRMIVEDLKLIRYADDFIVLCKSSSEAQKALVIAREELETKLGLELHSLPTPAYRNDSKTRIVNPSMHFFSFLSIRFDGNSVWIHNDKVVELREKIRDITDVTLYSNDPSYKGLVTILPRLRNLIEGWLSAFRYVDVEREFSGIDIYINRVLLTLLNKLDLKIKTSLLTKGKVNGKYVETLTTEQRINTGIPPCESILKKIGAKKIIV